MNDIQATQTVTGGGSNMIPLIGAASGLLGSVVNAVTSSIQNKKQREWNAEQSELAYQRDIEQWNRANAYNSPAEQMRRLQEAGLNKNLMYSQGNPGTAVSRAPDYKPAQGSYQLPPIDFSVINAYQDFRMKQEEIRFRTAQASDMQSKATISKYLALLKPYEIEYLTGIYDLGDPGSKNKPGLWDYNLQGREITNRQRENQILQIIADIKNKEQTHEKLKYDTEKAKQESAWKTTKNQVFGETNINIDKDKYIERLISDMFGVTIQKILSGSKMFQHHLLTP